MILALRHTVLLRPRFLCTSFLGDILSFCLYTDKVKMNEMHNGPPGAAALRLIQAKPAPV